MENLFHKPGALIKSEKTDDLRKVFSENGADFSTENKKIRFFRKF